MNVIIMPHGKSELVERFCCGEKTLIVDIGDARFPHQVLYHLDYAYATSPFEFLADVDEDELSEIKGFDSVIFYSYQSYSEHEMSVERIAGALDGWSDVTFMFNSI